MKDRFGREIDYLRISVTDRCNLRCRYCMPHGITLLPREEILRLEEILCVCRSALSLGMHKFKITGGEPLVRGDVTALITALKATEGVSSVTMTTNGILLQEFLPELIAAGIDGINVSLDTINAAAYAALTGSGQLERVLYAVDAAAASGIRTKLNAVLLRKNAAHLVELVRWANALSAPVDLRLIELMPIGGGVEMEGLSCDEALSLLRLHWPDLRPVPLGEARGNGPAAYFQSDRLSMRVGLIGANSHMFCDHCNRVRLTSTGQLKACLCYENASDLRALLRGGATEAAITQCIHDSIWAKPLSHCFSTPDAVTEHARMNEIGG